MKTIYILGCGAIGVPLAAHLKNAGRQVIAVRTSRTQVSEKPVAVSVSDGQNTLRLPLQTIALSQLSTIDGILVITAKAFANAAIAAELVRKRARGPIVIMQNGLGVEAAFLDAGLSPLCRCVLYATGEATGEHSFAFRPIAPSPIGIVQGHEAELRECIDSLNTSGFPFIFESDIRRETWKKTIINTVFNSICPLLEADNGVFGRDPAVEALARELVRECLPVAEKAGAAFSEDELMERIQLISGRSRQIISTLQDIRHGRPTEIQFLNLAIAAFAARQQPNRPVPKVEFLGKLILAKASQQHSPQDPAAHTPPAPLLE